MATHALKIDILLALQDGKPRDFWGVFTAVKRNRRSALHDECSRMGRMARMFRARLLYRWRVRWALFELEADGKVRCFKGRMPTVWIPHRPNRWEISMIGRKRIQ